MFLFGHSLGGVYAPLVDEGDQFKGVALYGAVLKSWHEYLLDMFSEQAVMMGTPKTTAAANTRLIQPLLDAWLNTDRNWDEILNDPDLSDAFAAQLLPHQGDQVFQRHHSFFRDLNRYDLAKAWQRVQAPVLVMHGAHDIQTINDQWAKDLTALLTQDSPDQATLAIFTNTGHGLKRHDSFDALRQAMNEDRYNPAQPGEHYNKEVAKTLIQWMDRSQRGGKITLTSAFEQSAEPPKVAAQINCGMCLVNGPDTDSVVFCSLTIDTLTPMVFLKARRKAASD